MSKDSEEMWRERERERLIKRNRGGKESGKEREKGGRRGIWE